MRLQALLLLFVSAGAEGPDEEGTARLRACFAELQASFPDLESSTVMARAEAHETEQAYEARVGALCEAGDRDDAASLAEAIEAGFYAADPEASALRDCLEDAFGEYLELPHVCDQTTPAARRRR